jgi:cyclopropane-fatty-acyl-phospholipid synthase
MNSQLYSGQLRHRRSHTAEHHFTHSLHLYLLDLDELDILEAASVSFGHNRLRPLSIHDRDYLHPGEEPLRRKVERVLIDHGIDQPLGRVMLLTALRQWNYVFNPASFFYCYDKNNELICNIVQVNNTFGEMHLYVLKAGEAGQVVRADKMFHVSPFFPRKGYYQFEIGQPEWEVSVRLTYFLDDKLALEASFTGTGEALSGRVMARTLILHPFRAALTFPRILWQAARLFVQKKLQVHPKPEPCSPSTIRGVPPPLLERVGKKVVTAFFRRLDHGQLTMHLPDDQGTLVFGSAASSPQVSLTVHQPRFFQRVMLAADIGFGESYVDGDWSSPDLVELLTLISLREEAIDDRSLWSALPGRMGNLISHARRGNTPAGSRRNIRDHYDLSNELYGLFLDPSMSYSSGIFLNGDDSLEQAQKNKVQAIIAKADIGPEDQVLEIGCGWGGLALEVVKQSGCRLLGITISREQFDWATRRVREEGLEDRIEIRLSDYRHVHGRFSRIISIEMLEAVGHRHLPGYFKVIDDLLAPQGKVVLQVITMPDQKYLQYRLGSDWLRKHIFPGGHLPSVAAMVDAMASRTRLNICNMEDIGRHYVPTLEIWRKALLAKSEQVMELGFDAAFLRKWEYYFCYCEAGFRTRLVRNYQLVLNRMGELQ